MHGTIKKRDNWRKRAFLAWDKARFFATPRKRRVALKLERDGRHIPFLLASLRALKMAVQSVASPVVFREAQAMKAPPPVLYLPENQPLQTDILITDSPEFARRCAAKRTLLLDHRFFDEKRPGLRMPYFMFPGMYHNRYHELISASPVRSRSVRLGFFGTNNTDFYTRNFHFPMLTRPAVLDRFTEVFADRITLVSGPPESWPAATIAMATDRNHTDPEKKVYLPLKDYLRGLGECDFVLCPPGWCMPFSHNLVEAMAQGGIPVLNYAGLFTPPLQDGVNCLTFGTLEEMETQVKRLLEMPTDVIARMREAVETYYRTIFKPGVWLQEVLRRNEHQTIVLVNNEQVSIGLDNREFAIATHTQL